MTNDIIIRKAELSDIENLKRFFIKAYGENTIFQNEQFLRYYFYSKSNEIAPLNASIVGLNTEDEIVSHYGGLFYNLRINNETYPIIWGVNAYTLAEYRGMGLNSKIVNIIIESNEINGVIGFTQKTASFYQKLGYNIFYFERFTRYIQIFDYEKTYEAIKFIKQNTNRFKELIKDQNKRESNSNFDNIIHLTKKNICYFDLNLDEDLIEITTTNRTKEFLIWRFFDNPIKYCVYGFVVDGIVQAYIVLREEILEPINYKVNRVIDLYGKKERINTLLDKSIQESVLKNHIYIDFSMFGTVYEKELIYSQFIKLENEDCCILPQVTSPIENRANGEFVGIQSKRNNKIIANLSKESVYFTRIDSDRDRSAQIAQKKD